MLQLVWDNRAVNRKTGYKISLECRRESITLWMVRSGKLISTQEERIWRVRWLTIKMRSSIFSRRCLEAIRHLFMKQTPSRSFLVLRASNPNSISMEALPLAEELERNILPLLSLCKSLMKMPWEMIRSCQNRSMQVGIHSKWSRNTKHKISVNCLWVRNKRLMDPLLTIIHKLRQRICRCMMKSNATTRSCKNPLKTS